MLGGHSQPPHAPRTAASWACMTQGALATIACWQPAAPPGLGGWQVEVGLGEDTK